MDGVRIWGMRVAAAISLALGAFCWLAAVESHQSASYVSLLDHRGLATIVLPLLFIGTGMIAVVASTPRFAEAKQLRICAALLLLLSAVLFVFGYSFEIGAQLRVGADAPAHGFFLGGRLVGAPLNLGVGPHGGETVT